MWVIKVIYITIALILTDIVSGILKAAYQKKLNSKSIKKGGLKKLSSLIIIITCMIIEHGLILLDYQYIPLTLIACIYISIMEVISIIENIQVMNPNIKGLISLIYKILGGNENDDGTNSKTS